MIIPKDLSYATAIIAEEILDTVSADFTMSQNCGKGLALCGSKFIKDQLITLLNLPELLQLVTPNYNRLCSNQALSRKKVANQKIKILVVEDTQVFAKALKNILEQEGYQAVLAQNGLEGLALLQKDNFNLIISDIEMPKMDGLEFIKSVRAEDKFKNLPVIALTSLDDEEHRQIALAAGFDYYEIKLKEQELMKTVKKILAEARSVM